MPSSPCTRFLYLHLSASIISCHQPIATAMSSLTRVTTARIGQPSAPPAPSAVFRFSRDGLSTTVARDSRPPTSRFFRLPGKAPKALQPLKRLHLRPCLVLRSIRPSLSPRKHRNPFCNESLDLGDRSVPVKAQRTAGLMWKTPSVLCTEPSSPQALSRRASEAVWDGQVRPFPREVFGWGPRVTRKFLCYVVLKRWWKAVLQGRGPQDN
jgi:hypothetical protein